MASYRAASPLDRQFIPHSDGAAGTGWKGHQQWCDETGKVSQGFGLKSGTISPVKRRLFNLLAGGSLLMCVACAAITVRSYWRLDCGEVDILNSRTTFAASRSRVRLEIMQRFPNSSSYVSIADSKTILPYNFHPRTQSDWGNRLGVDWSWLILSGNFNPPRHFLSVLFPLWISVILMAISPAVWIWRRSRQIANDNLCTHCGYDLRATPGRCPECGMVPKPTKYSN
jgi:hypothetical protein